MDLDHFHDQKCMSIETSCNKNKASYYLENAFVFHYKL